METIESTTVDAPERKIDWGKCILCQKISVQTLQCPVKSKRTDVGAGYKYVSENLKEFSDLNCLPFDIDIKLLDEGTGIESTLQTHNASWHKSCRDKISNDKLERLRKRKREKPSNPSPVKTRRSNVQPSDSNHCIFCNKTAGNDSFHRASTFELDFKVRKYALELKDTQLLAKLSAGDMVAIEAKYHKKCLSAFYRRGQAAIKETVRSSKENAIHGLAFADLVSYLESFIENNESSPIPVFHMSSLNKIYCTRLNELGLTGTTEVHTTRLKNRLLSALPSLREYTEKGRVLLAFDKDVGTALKQMSTQDFDSEALLINKVAKIIRRDIFEEKQNFNGSFTENCQVKSVPATLAALVSMILEGPKLKDQSDNEQLHSSQSINISQLIVFNSLKTSSTSTIRRHDKDRETPLPIYLALKVHGETRKRNLVDVLYNNGLCISYDRLLTISTDIVNSVCATYCEEGVVCPQKLSNQLFTTAAVDNIDHNPSSTTSTDSFHGTSISIMQHPRLGFEGVPRIIHEINDTPSRKGKKIASLPVSYTNVPPAVNTKKDYLVPLTSVISQTEVLSDMSTTLTKEYEWLNNLQHLLDKSELDIEDYISWAAFHASRQLPFHNLPTTVTLMPLFLDCAHSIAMIKHSMNVIRDVIQVLNSGQVPVIAMDQPLFALAKTIQWSFPDTHGEDQFLIMLGGLHIEMAAFKVLGNWLEGSGWTTAITNADIASSGVADSCLKAAHLTRTRHAHQVTSAALFILLNQAYNKYKQITPEDMTMDFDVWCSKLKSEQPQFLYWSLVLELELCIFSFIGSLREGNFIKYVESLLHLIPWFFSLDHTNYARWLSVHIRDMKCLSQTIPTVYQEFLAGGFVAFKTTRPFSAMALDQAHEQSNAVIKGEGGAVGLTENISALTRWMVAGPEISRMIEEYEFPRFTANRCSKHHDQSPTVQSKFQKEVNQLITIITDLGNPFTEDSGNLLTLDTKDIMEQVVADSVSKL